MTAYPRAIFGGESVDKAVPEAAVTMHNQRIKWASRVIFALPEDMVERI